MINKNKIIFASILLLFIIININFINAIGEELYYDYNETIDIKIFCFDVNSSLCNNDSTTCMLTVFYPNNTLYVNNQTMSSMNTYYNYTIGKSLTRGVYSVVVTCVKGLDSGYKTFDFYVGLPSTQVQQDTILISVAVLFGISIFLFMAFYFTDKPPIRWTYFIFALMFLIATLNLISVTLANQAVNVKIESYFNTLTAMSFYILWFCSGILIVMWIFTFLYTILWKQQQKKTAKFA
jgi:hypothetical protein